MNGLGFGNRVACPFDGKHSFHRYRRPFSRVIVHIDLIDDIAFNEILQNPAEVRQIDPVHRRAETLTVGEHDDLLLGMLLCQAVDEVDFSADRPFAAGRGGFDLLDDVSGRAG